MFVLECVFTHTSPKESVHAKHYLPSYRETCAAIAPSGFAGAILVASRLSRGVDPLCMIFAGVAAHVQCGTSGAAQGSGGCADRVLHHPGRHCHPHPCLCHAQHLPQLRASHRVPAGQSLTPHSEYNQTLMQLCLVPDAYALLLPKNRQIIGLYYGKTFTTYYALSTSATDVPLYRVWKPG